MQLFVRYVLRIFFPVCKLCGFQTSDYDSLMSYEISLTGQYQYRYSEQSNWKNHLQETLHTVQQSVTPHFQLCVCVTLSHERRCITSHGHEGGKPLLQPRRCSNYVCLVTAEANEWTGHSWASAPDLLGFSRLM